MECEESAKLLFQMPESAKKKNKYFYPGIKQFRLGENKQEVEIRCSRQRMLKECLHITHLMVMSI